jgi:uncharacterized membrane protein YkvA (DUF1232 family)
MNRFESLFQRRWISIFQILFHFRKFLKLYIRLLRDKRLPFYLKLLFFISILYILSPVDIIPEAVFSVFGIVDDAGMFLLILKLFLRLCPREVLQEHVAGMVRQ